MEYHYKEKYKVEKTTCGKMSKKLADADGDTFGFAGLYFVEERGERPTRLNGNWSWIQEQRSNKRIYVLDHIKSKARFTKSSINEVA